MHFGASFNYFDIMAAAKKNYTRLLEPVCQEMGLTRNELDVMLFLHNNPEYDRATDIVTRRGIAKSHVSLSVANLESKGLLVREYDEQDRRIAHLKLTDAAVAIAEHARQKQLQYFSALYEGITEEEFILWRKVTQKVCGNIEKLEGNLTDAEQQG